MVTVKKHKAKIYLYIDLCSFETNSGNCSHLIGAPCKIHMNLETNEINNIVDLLRQSEIKKCVQHNFRLQRKFSSISSPTVRKISNGNDNWCCC